MRWTPASQMRVLLSPTKTPMFQPGHSSRCAGPLKAAKPCETRASFGCESRAVPSVDWYETCRGNRLPRVMSLGKEFEGLSLPNQPTTIFCEVWKPFKKARPLQKMYPPFLLVEDGKGEFRFCRIASGIWTSWTGAGNCPISPILPACWLSGSRKTSLLGTCSIWSWQQQNRAKWQAECKLSLQSIQGRPLLVVNGVITTTKGRK